MIVTKQQLSQSNINQPQRIADAGYIKASVTTYRCAAKNYRHPNREQTRASPLKYINEPEEVCSYFIESVSAGDKHMSMTERVIEAVWEKGRGLPDRDTTEWRKDQCGAWMQRTQFNNPNSEYGWTVVNVSPGGEEDVSNLQPFHLNNSFNIASGKPHCRVTADRTGISPTQSIDQPHNTPV